MSNKQTIAKYSKIKEYDEYKNSIVETALKKEIFNNKTLLEEQREVLKNYYKYLYSIGAVSKDSSALTVLRYVKQFALYLKKPFNHVKKQNFLDFIDYMRFERKVKLGYLNQMLIYIKAFYKFVYQTEEYPDVVKWIKPKIKTTTIRVEDLLTKEEVLKLIKVSDDARDKAIITLLRDSGGRVEETLLRPKIKDLIIDEHGAKLSVDGKTGRRNIRLIDCVPYLQDWLNKHPSNNDPNASLFVSLKGKSYGNCLKYQSVISLLRKVKKRAKLAKRVNPHSFRHSAVTEMSLKGFNEAELRIIFGWENNSKMPSRYTHIKEKQIDDKILEKAGKLKIDDQKELEREDKILQPKVCVRCKKVNLPEAKYCNCGMALDLKTAIKEEETNKTIQLLMEIAKNPQLLKQLEAFKKQQRIKWR